MNARWSLWTALSLMLIAGAWAEDNTSQVSTNGTVTDWGATTLVVGNTGLNNTLLIGNGSGITNVTYAYLGKSAGANYNTLIVTDPGSIFNGKQFNDGFWIGNSGAFNRFIVSNQAVSTIGPGYIGRFAGADGNGATITGSGSVWSNDIIYVGWSGLSNDVTIADGGQMDTRYGFMVLGYQPGSDGNRILVTGNQSKWTTGSSLNIGYYGNFNQLILTNGGYVSIRSVDDSWLGYYSNANHNAAIVTDPGTFWDAGVILYVGNFGASNRVDILNAGSVSAQGVVIGVQPSAIDNAINVLGGNLVVTNNSANAGPLEIRNGTLNISNGTVLARLLVLTNVTGRCVFDSGTLVAGKTTVANGTTFVVGDGLHAATMKLTGTTNTFADVLIVSANATVILTNQSVTEFWGPVVNNGFINAIYGTANFHGGYSGSGLLLDANGDADGDGISNYNEARTGTDPLNPQSYTHPTAMTVTGNDVILTWVAGGGHSNIVEYSALPGSNFTNTPAGHLYIPGSGDVSTNYVDLNAATNTPARYYRIRVIP